VFFNSVVLNPFDPFFSVPFTHKPQKRLKDRFCILNLKADGFKRSLFVKLTGVVGCNPNYDYHELYLTVLNNLDACVELDTYGKD